MLSTLFAYYDDKKEEKTNKQTKYTVMFTGRLTAASMQGSMWSARKASSDGIFVIYSQRDPLGRAGLAPISAARLQGPATPGGGWHLAAESMACPTPFGAAP